MHPFALLSGPQAVQLPSSAQVLPECSRCCCPQDHKPTRERKRNERKSRNNKGTRDKSEKAEASQQAHKERDTPPIASWQDAAPLITNSRQKISKKSLGVVLKKFSEKFFGGMFRGKKNPLRYLNGRGCLTNENREISNLAMQITKKQKH